MASSRHVTLVTLVTPKNARGIKERRFFLEREREEEEKNFLRAYKYKSDRVTG